jgi:glycerol-3-phosphate acyltransferase PlsY
MARQALTMMTLLTWSTLLVAYLLGSIPSACIASRLVLGRDIRQLGDGNMGAKNTFHSLGWLAGTLVAAADITKGALAVVIARGLQPRDEIVLIAGACAILGHDFPVFARFRGGQGMATILGVFGMIFPQATILALCVLGLSLAVSHNWDLSCAVAFISLVGVIWTTGQPPRRVLYPFLVLPTIGVRKAMQEWQARHIAIQHLAIGSFTPNGTGANDEGKSS